MTRTWVRIFSATALIFAQAALAAPAPATATPQALVMALDKYPHAVQKDTNKLEVADHEIGLGPIQKFGGAWQFEVSERVSGYLSRYTWQIIDGFSAIEVMQEFVAELQKIPGSKELFSCEGRSCGHPAQWANRVFNQRVLYGRQEMQRYRVYAIEGEPAYRLAIYAGSRTSDRHYLHIDLLEMTVDSAVELEAETIEPG